MSAHELSRLVKLRAIKHEPVVVEADEAERAALAARFGITTIDSLRAEVALDPDGQRVAATGMLAASITQPCAISGEDFPVAIDEELDFVFVPASESEVAVEGEEIELEREDLDEIEYRGDSFDLGEAIAQSLALAIDPYAEGPNADAARERAGIVTEDTPSGPLAEALAALKKN
ncbi:YceD family protein [Erythrobacter litoralis]|uniref:DNA-binding protein n=1 Tax=Erythrobacter litoralis (strain HTCC2594) TaxID=314225 RepID=Q2NDV9_ERYLH|nr:YceD family protein [Erythrobacter litoralis]ABC62132.1 hypothetical protein ELI_00200 [Erythrobacter litoralis HTCC2594]